LSIQNKYWKDLVQLRFDLFYLDEYCGQSYEYDKYINIITAIASSSSIGAWAIWNELNFLWSFIIVISQVINATKSHLPFNNRTKYITKLHSELSTLYNEWDYNWLKVSNGDLTEKDINDLIFENRKKKQKIHNKYFSNNHLPLKQKFVKKADIELKHYFAV